MLLHAQTVKPPLNLNGIRGASSAASPQSETAERLVRVSAFQPMDSDFLFRRLELRSVGDEVGLLPFGQRGDESVGQTDPEA